ncbi:NAD(P)H-hydrate epimerase [Arthrobacter sp. 35W]|uniref:NAD(P)H-hydrate epimerase n=1 Tax=Arthrobacter sp. 35W TaxID=1132441 RepID=UPI0003F9E6FB|nr:NAD(P)H-hydrate epimerase [Arthrobacter sp. 35W]
MLAAYTGTDVRAAEAPLLAAGRGGELMARAAHGLAVEVARMLRARRGRVYGSRVAILAGAGNNGGDALYAGAELAARGARVVALLATARIHEAALAAFHAAGGRSLPLEAGPAVGAGGGPSSGASSAILGEFLAEAAAADVLLDGLLGTGGRGPLRGPAAIVVHALAGMPGPMVVAVDLPSGLDADTGHCTSEVLRADATVTFGAAKAGLLLPPGEGHAGRIHVVDIGLAPWLEIPAVRRLEAGDLALLLPSPTRDSHKYRRGVLGIAAGSKRYPGAAVLSTGAAVACGAGMVRFLGPEPVARLIHAAHPEVVVGSGSVAENHVQAWLVGPGIDGGMDGGEDQAQHARDAMASSLPTVVDASALPLVETGLWPGVILTPHAGELAALLSRLDGETTRTAVEADPHGCATKAAALTGATVLLKGATTIVAAPDGTVFSQADGTPWLATAGSGDVLAGILGALAAALADDVERFSRLGIPAGGKWAAIAAMAASLHGRAAAAVGGPLHAGALSGVLPAVWRSLAGG